MPRLAAVLLSAALAGCAPRLAPPEGEPPPFLLGASVDDYGIGYTVSPEAWVQHPSARYHVRLWRPERGYLIAQNDAANPSDGGRWTRIDWVRLEGMAPYEWAFCLTAYDAASAAEAEAAPPPERGTPRTGCNGYPFSRMRRATPADSLPAAGGYGRLAPEARPRAQD